MTQTAPLLSVRGVVKHFGGIKAVVDGNLEIARGEMHGLVGPNGCGKSTLLNIVTGNVRPDRGAVEFDGAALPTGQVRATQARGIFLVAQELAIAPQDTVWQSIVLGSEPRRRGFVDRRQSRRMAAAAIASIGHEFDLNAPVSTLTAVEQRLVTIARGAARPGVRLLILDEPTAGLPHEEADRVLNAMAKLVKQDRSVVLVSHDIDDVVAACDRVTLMRDGGTTRTLAGDELLKQTIVDHLLAGVKSASTIRDDRDLGECVAKMDDVHGVHLQGLSFTARRGEVVGFAGLLGSGCREVVQLLSGQCKPRSGAVEVGAGGVTPMAPHLVLGRGVGYVSGDRSSMVIREMTVGEHVALPMLSKLSRGGFISRGRERRLVHSSLQALSVKGAGDAMMTSLSGGNQQRALTSRWVGAGTDLLVVDQPTVGVDLAGRAQLLQTLRALAENQAVVLVAEPEELSVICDRVFCMRRGMVAVELCGDDITEEGIISAIA